MEKGRFVSTKDDAGKGDTGVLVTLSLCCFWAWEASLVYAPSLTVDGLGPSDLWGVSNYATLAVCVALLLLRRRVLAVLPRRSYAIAALMLIEAETVAVVVLNAFPNLIPAAMVEPVAALSAVLGAVGIIMMDVLFVYLLAFCTVQPPGRLLMWGSAGHLLAYLLVDNLPALAGYGCAVSLPVIAVALCARSLVSVSSDAVNLCSQETGLGLRSLVGELPWRYLAAFFVVSFSINFIRSVVFHDAGEENPFSGSIAISMTFIFVTFAAGLDELRLSKGKASAVPYVAVLYVTIAVISYANGMGIYNLVVALVFAAFFLYVTVFYRVACERVRRSPAGIVAIAAGIFCTNSLGLSCGTVCYSLVGEAAATTTSSLLLSAAYLVFIGGTGLHMLAKSSIAAAPENSPMQDERSSRLASALEESCSTAAESHGLTPREAEVLVLLAQQFSYLQIAERMGVSPNTAKSHIRHVYQKLGVHSGDELFSALLGSDSIRD